ncbi:Signal transduction histidine-protein kinase BarA [Nocardioides aquaticus]|uniref:histidine kinase n=1 Tax=Nocardioides aquaticus TaxID=160826 RepID=A0ABX8EK34_9ACTN|nr:response regulator [Nocardioides aquaticus]QVT79433.1 Signal transduction histidine-protein kinase BarA [Nocardioides aquaticus]
MDDDDPGGRILAAFTDAVLDLGLDGRIRYANTSAAALLGAEDLVGRDIGDFLDEDGRLHSSSHLARAARGIVIDGEVDTLLVRGDGSPRWVRLRQTALREGDRVTSVVLRMTDNHHDRELLEALRASQAGLVRAERIARSGSFTWHPATGDTSSSAGLVELYGDHLAALLAVDRTRLLGMTHPEDHARLEDNLGDLLSGAADEIDVELRQLGRHGWMWVRLRAEGTRDAAGVLVEVSGTYQDVTRSRAAEDRLQDLVTQNSLMQAVATAANEAGTLDEVLLLARDLVVLHDDWDRARAFLPCPGGTGLVPHLPEEHPATDAGATDVATRELATASRCLELGAPVWDEVDRLTIAFPVRLDEEVVAVLTLTSLPPLHRHELIEEMAAQAALLIARVAERERARGLLADARDRAVSASQHKSDFLATMSHEIRTPLNGIVGLNELLGATALSDRQQHLVSGVAVSSRSLLDLINDILDFSKIEAGHLGLERVDLEVREVLAEVGGVLAESARSRGIDLEVSCAPDVPEVLSGDPTRLKQVLLNLGSNAVKFTAEGSVTIRATASPAADGTLLRVEVGDTGVGITPDQQRAVFAPFSQADTSTTRTFGGTGLGLAICAEIVAAFGGEIGVDSVPGAGSTFWFTAHLGPATGSTEDATSVRARAVLGGTRVLVVDDTPRNRMILVEQLGWWGVVATEAAGAVAAMAALEGARAAGEPYDVVLLDLNMPGSDGLDLAAAVRAGGYPADLPLLLLTSSLTPTPEDLAGAGITTSLTKPVPSSTLRDALLSVLAGSDDAPRDVRPAPAPTGQGRVLVVEDNPINQMVARGFLEAQGYVVETAEDGEQALAAVATGAWDAVLMDVQMPRLDGYATTRVLRRERATTGDGRRLPIIAMTAAAVTGEREKCLAAGMDDYLTKPVSAAALAAALARWVHRPATAAPDAPATDAPATDAPGATTEHPEDPMATPEPTPAAAAAAPDGPHLDQDRLADLLELGPPHDFLDRAIGNFLRRRTEVVAALVSAVADRDHARLSAAAHELRGGAANLGLPVVVDLARRLEERGDTGEAVGCEPLLADLAVALGEAGEAIASYRDWFRATTSA